MDAIKIDADIVRDHWKFGYHLLVNPYINPKYAYVCKEPRYIVVHPNTHDVLLGYGRVRRWFRRVIRQIKLTWTW